MRGPSRAASHRLQDPRPDQLFPGITGFGGQGVLPLVGSPNLKPETSTNYELAAYYEGQRCFNVTGFFNTFEDKIASGGTFANCEVARQRLLRGHRPGLGGAGSTFTQSVNIDKAETRGAELAAHVDLLDTLQLRGNYTWTRSEQTSGAQKGLPISGTMPARHMANASLNWQVNEAISLSLIGEGPRPLPRHAAGRQRRQPHPLLPGLHHLPSRWQLEGHAMADGERTGQQPVRQGLRFAVVPADQPERVQLRGRLRDQDQRRSYWISLNAKF